jgi:16S rRNA (guanine1207-N2)-methyltransferase
MPMSSQSSFAHAVYGSPSAALCVPPANALQVSPLHPGSTDLAGLDGGSVANITMLAPPGTIERRYAIAQALRALQPGGLLTLLAPKDAGGGRLVGDLAGFGIDATAVSKRHHRICTVLRPPTITGLDEAISAAITAGGPQAIPGSHLWSQPGLFSWDRADPGSLLLLEYLPKFSGHGADFGCGFGLLTGIILLSPKVIHLTAIDVDGRAIKAVTRNVKPERTTIVWADIRTLTLPPTLDFVVMNPPFHTGGAEDRALGTAFITKAAACLKTGGELWLTANRHLPYEAVLTAQFKTIEPIASANGFKVYKAVK